MRLARAFGAESLAKKSSFRAAPLLIMSETFIESTKTVGGAL
jgi:hypothetical protein